MNADPFLAEVSDGTYVEMCRLIAKAAKSLEEDYGETPTVKQFADVLAAALQETGPGVFNGVSPQFVQAVRVSFSKVRSVRPGAVVGFPASSGGWFRAVVLKRTRFGDPLGILKGVARRLNESIGDNAASELVCYSTLASIKDRKLFLSRLYFPELVSRFPDQPEIYHRNEDNRGDPKIGKFGVAETPSGELREIDQEEAEKVGLLDKTNRAAYLEVDFSRFLEARHRNGQI